MTAKVVTAAQTESVRKMATDKGIGKDDFQKYGLDGGIIAKALDAIKTAATGAVQAVANTYHLVVDHGKTLAEMIALGRYDWVNSDITDPPLEKGTGTIEVDAELIHFNRSIGSDEALRELDRLGYRAATAQELLAFGAAYPEKQREFPIVALGTVRHLNGFRRVLCLWLVRSGRSLRLDWFDDDWYDYCRFLAVRK